MKTLKLTLLALCVVGVGYSQQANQTVLDATNQPYFSSSAVELSASFWSQKRAAERYALEQNVLIREPLANGAGFIEIIRLLPSGTPEYLMTYNEGSQRTTNVDFVRPRGELGLNLTGKGIIIGVWDGDNFDDTHTEFSGRVEVRGSISDQELGLGGNHSTHVTGTVGAHGERDDAQGMAPDAQLFVYDFLNDDSEIAEELAKEDEILLVSNHSYGLVLGWQPTNSGWIWRGDASISGVEDYRFGFYNQSESVTLDEFARNAPYYLHVRAAGNDRTDVGDGSRPADGPFDIIGPAGVAKNVMTVGAVEKIENRFVNPEDVVMSNFSSWGPTDDGRIKPDLVAPGVDILSTYAEGTDEYGLLSGTSMAAPAVTGSLALLQELYFSVFNGEYMKSATLKGLAIHTVNEAGDNPGPDYSYGWGLLAIDKAANLIIREDQQRFLIKESFISEGIIRVETVVSDGNSPLVATLSWTDPPGTPVEPQLDPRDTMLVNDLNIRVQGPSDNTFLPWTLNPARPEDAAEPGVNFLDNVEKVEIPNPEAGTYVIIIEVNGEIEEDQQDYSLIVSTGDLSDERDAFYWVGGNGDWNDGANWSGSSGGASIGQVPSSNDLVYFDENSFASADNTINFNGNGDCFHFNWYATENITFELGGNNLTVNGSINFENTQNINFQNGEVRFTASLTARNSVNVTPNAFANVDLVFQSTNGSWNVTSNLNTQSITLDGSSFSIVDKTLVTSDIAILNGAGQTLNFRGSTITGISNFIFSPGTNADFSNSKILFDGTTGPANFTFDGADQTFNDLEVINGSITIEGDNTFNQLSISGDATFNGTNTINTLTLDPGSTLTLAENSTQTINTEFSALGATGDSIRIASAGGAGASLFSNDPFQRFCFDYMNIEGVSVDGETRFVSGNNSVLVASDGWIEADCDDLLFPGFDATFLCATGVAQFTDRSTGDVNSWSWDFGDPQFAQENSATEQNPRHQYRFAGTYDVTLTVGNGDTTESFTRQIVIEDAPTDLLQPIVQSLDNVLTSSVVAPSYQWFFNGEMIEGATERSLSVTELGPYAVEVANETCRLISDPLLVTGLEDEQLRNSIVLFPNPTVDRVELEMTNDLTGPLGVIIFNTTGQKVTEFEDIKSGKQYVKSLDLGGLQAGLYHLVFSIADLKVNKRLIIQ